MASASIATLSNAKNLISNNNNPYLGLHTFDPTYNTIIKTDTFVLPHRQLLVTAPHSSEELIEIARKACGLMLRAEAEKARHIHYSSSNATSVDSSIKSSDGDSNQDDDSIKMKLESCSTGSNSSNSQFANDGTIVKQEFPSPVNNHQLLNNSQRVRSNRKHRRNRTHQSNATSPKSNETTHVRPKHKVNSVDNGSQTRVKQDRTRDAARPRLFIRFGYKKEFLAGPPEKTEVGDRRIFYQRKLFCWRV